MSAATITACPNCARHNVRVNFGRQVCKVCGHDRAHALPATEHNRLTLDSIAETVNARAMARGFDGFSFASFREVVLTLAEQGTAFDYLDDQETRIGIDVADLRVQLVAAYQAAGQVS